MDKSRPHGSSTIQCVADADALYDAAAALFAQAAVESVRAAGAFTVALAGGSTPKRLYSRLAADPVLRTQVPWDKVHFFWGDERHVPPDHPESNFRAAHEAMLSRLPVDWARVCRMKGEYPDACTAADEYEENLRAVFQLERGQLPRLDLVLLGLGPDGHTASLFPGTLALVERRRLCVSNWVGKLSEDRITLTVPVFNNASFVLFLVQGAEKARALKAVLDKRFEPEQLPANLIQPRSGRVLWLVDRAAANLLATAAARDPVP